MAKTLIIGYGNPLRGDDGLGWHAARLLAGVAQTQHAELLARHQLMPELAEQASGAETVIFVDAASEGRPGELRWRCVEPQPGPASFTHHLSPEALLGMARDLYGRCPRAFAVSVAGGSFDCGEELSPAVRAALPALIGLVEKLLSGEITKPLEEN
jgi:hydrogenase maturation protease